MMITARDMADRINTGTSVDILEDDQHLTVVDASVNAGGGIEFEATDAAGTLTVFDVPGSMADDPIFEIAG